MDEPNLSLSLKGGFLALLFILSALFSMSETALFSLGRLARKRLNNKAINRLLERPNRLLVDLLTGNNIVNILASSLSASIVLELCRRFDVNEGVGVGLGVVVMTVSLLVFGEIGPKTLAVMKAESIAPALARIIGVYSYIIFPVREMLLGVTSIFSVFLERILGLKKVHSSPFAKEELTTVLRVGQEEGVLEESDMTMIRGIFRFGERLVKEVMIPRQKIVFGQRESSVKDILGLIQQTGFSRIPICDGSLDNIIGVVHARDFLTYLSDDVDGGAVIPERLLRPVYVDHPNKRIDELWHELQRRRYQMAVIKDRYDRLMGLVTLEDLLEEIVGEIEDEYDLLVGSR